MAGSTTTTPGTPSGTPKPTARPATPAETAADTPKPEQVRPKPPKSPRDVAAADPATSSGGSVGTGSIVPKIINRPAPEPTSSGHGMVSKPTTPYVEKAPEPASTKVAEAKPSIEPAATAKPSTTSSAKPGTVSEPAPGNSTFTALTPSATTQALVGFAGLVGIALGLFAWTRHREQLSLTAAGGREFGSVNFETGDARTGRVVARLRVAPPATGPGQRRRRRRSRPPPTCRSRARARRPARCWARTPMPARRPSEKIVEGLRQSWHPDLATGEADRQLREQRTTQINVAWEILSGKRRPA